MADPHPGTRTRAHGLRVAILLALFAGLATLVPGGSSSVVPTLVPHGFESAPGGFRRRVEPDAPDPGPWRPRPRVEPATERVLVLAGGVEAELAVPVAPLADDQPRLLEEPPRELRLRTGEVLPIASPEPGIPDRFELGRALAPLEVPVEWFGATPTGWPPDGLVLPESRHPDEDLYLEVELHQGDAGKVQVETERGGTVELAPGFPAGEDREFSRIAVRWPAAAVRARGRPVRLRPGGSGGRLRAWWFGSIAPAGTEIEEHHDAGILLARLESEVWRQLRSPGGSERSRAAHLARAVVDRMDRLVASAEAIHRLERLDYSARLQVALARLAEALPADLAGHPGPMADRPFTQVLHEGVRGGGRPRPDWTLDAGLRNWRAQSFEALGRSAGAPLAAPVGYLKEWTRVQADEPLAGVGFVVWDSLVALTWWARILPADAFPPLGPSPRIREVLMLLRRVPAKDGRSSLVGALEKGPEIERQLRILLETLPPSRDRDRTLAWIRSGPGGATLEAGSP